MRLRTLVVILLAGTIGFLARRGPIHRLRALSVAVRERASVDERDAVTRLGYVIGRMYRPAIECAQALAAGKECHVDAQLTCPAVSTLLGETHHR
jgi:hypothetical protein